MALILITVTLTAGMQIRYMQQQPLGFNPEQVLVIKGPKAYDYGYQNNFSVFTNKINNLASVKSVSGAGAIPGQEIYWYSDRITINEKEHQVFSRFCL